MPVSCFGHLYCSSLRSHHWGATCWRVHRTALYGLCNFLATNQYLTTDRVLKIRLSWMFMKFHSGGPGEMRRTFWQNPQEPGTVGPLLLFLKSAFFFGRINFKSICAYKRSSQCKSKELIPYLKVGRTWISNSQSQIKSEPDPSVVSPS